MLLLLLFSTFTSLESKVILKNRYAKKSNQVLQYYNVELILVLNLISSK